MNTLFEKARKIGCGNTYYYPDSEHVACVCARINVASEIDYCTMEPCSLDEREPVVDFGKTFCDSMCVFVHRKNITEFE